MEEKSTFGLFAKYFIGSLFMLWMIVAFTLLGAFAGVLINLVVDSDIFIPKIIYTFAFLGFISGIAFGVYRLKGKFL